MNTPQFLNMYDVADITGLNVARQKKLEAIGRFPRSARVSQRLRVYLKSDIDAWIEAQLGQINSETRETSQANS